MSNSDGMANPDPALSYAAFVVAANWSLNSFNA
jgi:hypothetical protein